LARWSLPVSYSSVGATSIAAALDVDAIVIGVLLLILYIGFVWATLNS
jgi:hypothetical protein